MTPSQSLRLVIIAPDLVHRVADDEHASALAERSRQLRIGLLESGYNIVAVLPADTFLTERLAQLQPDMIIVDAESEARDSLESRRCRCDQPTACSSGGESTSGTSIAAGARSDTVIRPARRLARAPGR